MSNKAYYKIFFKTKYLSAELDECIEIQDNYKRLFLEELSAFQSSQKTSLKKSADSIKQNLKEESVQKKDVSKSIKNIYKEIMKIVHPDKVNFIEDGTLKESYKNMCTRATSAMDVGDSFIILDIANDLNIRIEDDEGEIAADLQNDCLQIAQKIEKIKKSYAWNWGGADEATQKEIFKSYVENIL